MDPINRWDPSGLIAGSFIKALKEGAGGGVYGTAYSIEREAYAEVNSLWGAIRDVANALSNADAWVPNTNPESIAHWQELTRRQNERNLRMGPGAGIVDGLKLNIDTALKMRDAFKTGGEAGGAQCGHSRGQPYRQGPLRSVEGGRLSSHRRRGWTSCGSFAGC